MIAEPRSGNGTKNVPKSRNGTETASGPMPKKVSRSAGGVWKDGEEEEDGVGDKAREEGMHIRRVVCPPESETLNPEL